MAQHLLLGGRQAYMRADQPEVYAGSQLQVAQPIESPDGQTMGTRNEQLLDWAERVNAAQLRKLPWPK